MSRARFLSSAPRSVARKRVRARPRRGRRRAARHSPRWAVRGPARGAPPWRWRAHGDGSFGEGSHSRPQVDRAPTLLFVATIPRLGAATQPQQFLEKQLDSLLQILDSAQHTAARTALTLRGCAVVARTQAPRPA